MTTFSIQRMICANYPDLIIHFNVAPEIDSILKTLQKFKNSHCAD